MTARYARGFLCVCTLGLIALAWRMLQPYLTPIVWAAVFVTASDPVYRWLRDRFEGHRRVAAALSSLLVSVLIIVPLVSLVFVLARQSVEAYDALRNFVASPQFESTLTARLAPFSAEWLSPLGLSNPERLEAGLVELLRRTSGFLVGQATQLVTESAGFFFSLGLMTVTMYVLFVDGHRILSFFKAVSPLSHTYEDRLLRCFQDVSIATIYGGLVTAMVQGIIGALMFILLGLPSPILWGTLMGMASFIPLVGTALIWVPAAGWLMLTGSLAKGVILVILGAAVINSVDNIVKPLIMRDRVRMHVLLVFLGILGGLHLFGVLGLVLGPLVIALLLEMLDILREELRRESVNDVDREIVKSPAARRAKPRRPL